jgi:hypothetical protein
MNGDTNLYRQISPSWIQGERATSQAFRPMPKDEGHLSCYDGDQITAERSWIHYTNVMGFLSVGVLAVSVSEFAKEELHAKSDPLTDFPEHATVDYTAFQKNAIESKSKRLQAVSSVRGWLFRPHPAT